MSEGSNHPKLDLTNTPRAWDDVFRLMSWWDSEVVANAAVMVIGAGALGNEVLKNLALLNVGNILVVDFDRIEYSNLSRSVLFREQDASDQKLKSEVAVRRVKEINPAVKMMTINGDVGIDVGLGVFRRMDAVIGCLDNRLARLMTNRNCFKVRKTWVDGAIENLAGQLNVYQPGVSCYECQLTESEWKQIRFKMGCPDIARRNKMAGRIPTTPISASVIGALQVQEALKVIYQNHEQSMAGQTFQYEGMNNMFLLHNASSLEEDCESHDLIEDIIEAPELSRQSTIAEICTWCQDYLKTEAVTIQLDHEVALEITEKESGRSHQILKAKPHLSDEYLASLDSGADHEYIITESLTHLSNHSPYADQRADAFGIPPLHILHVETDDDIFFVELSGDTHFLNFV